MGVNYTTEVDSFEWEIPESYAITSVVADHAASVGDRVAVRFRDDEGGREERTYADIRDDMNRFANGLEAEGVTEEVIWEGDEAGNDISERLMDDFACAIREGRQPKTSLEKSLIPVSITDGIYRSAEQGTSVDILGDWPL